MERPKTSLEKSWSCLGFFLILGLVELDDRTLLQRASDKFKNAVAGRGPERTLTIGLLQLVSGKTARMTASVTGIVAVCSSWFPTTGHTMRKATSLQHPPPPNTTPGLAAQEVRGIRIGTLAGSLKPSALPKGPRQPRGLVGGTSDDVRCL